MKKVFCLFLLAVLHWNTAWADSSGSDWSTSYGFAGAAKHQTNMTQADLIAKRESGYYDGLGKTNVNNINSNTIGTMTTMNTTISGNSNNVAADSLSSGSMDASIQLQTLISSTQNKTY
ncbi:hypothetical protein [Polaromonas sp.]|uniref:hypothetical protein n=1 Tax=Polaromonas sp. TaxID=1869339 RepID=UPI0013B867A6|nr:hypothetical protein [Polaromonas sp.]NDP65034.1 hypothetical protein [Polaromonas sp.]